jgi:hypothetical protein
MSGGSTPRTNALIALGAVAYCICLVLTGEMVWSDQRRDAERLAFRDVGGGDEAAFADWYVPEYDRTHRHDRLRWLVGFPLAVTGGSVLYFAPSLLALARRSPRAETIFMANVFCGLTIIGWLWAAQAALRSDGHSA